MQQDHQDALALDAAKRLSYLHEVIHRPVGRLISGLCQDTPSWLRRNLMYDTPEGHIAETIRALTIHGGQLEPSNPGLLPDPGDQAAIDWTDSYGDCITQRMNLKNTESLVLLENLLFVREHGLHSWKLPYVHDVIVQTAMKTGRFTSLVVLLHANVSLRLMRPGINGRKYLHYFRGVFLYSSYVSKRAAVLTDEETKFIKETRLRIGYEDREAWLRSIFSELPSREHKLKGVQYYNPFRKRMRHMLHWRRAVEAGRDAGMVFQAAAEGRPMELARRLRLGKLRGGHTRLGEVVIGGVVQGGYNALTAACAGGHGACVRVLADGLLDADEYVKGRDGGGRGCWEVAVGDAVDVLQEIREDPWMLCGDLTGV